MSTLSQLSDEDVKEIERLKRYDKDDRYSIKPWADANSERTRWFPLHDQKPICEHGDSGYRGSHDTVKDAVDCAMDDLRKRNHKADQ